jgi:hypothetical protein
MQVIDHLYSNDVCGPLVLHDSFTDEILEIVEVFWVCEGKYIQYKDVSDANCTAAPVDAVVSSPAIGSASCKLAFCAFSCMCA